MIVMNNYYIIKLEEQKIGPHLTRKITREKEGRISNGFEIGAQEGVNLMIFLTDQYIGGEIIKNTKEESIYENKFWIIEKSYIDIYLQDFYPELFRKTYFGKITYYEERTTEGIIIAKTEYTDNEGTTHILGTGDVERILDIFEGTDQTLKEERISNHINEGEASKVQQEITAVLEEIQEKNLKRYLQDLEEFNQQADIEEYLNNLDINEEEETERSSESMQEA